MGTTIIQAGSVQITIELPYEEAEKFVSLWKLNGANLFPYPTRVISLEHKPQRHGKTKILCMIADPSECTRLRLGKEHREIFDSIHRAKYGHNFDIQQIWAVNVRDVLRYLLYFEPDIVHFSGHGSESGSLVFENKDGSGNLVSPKALSALFSNLDSNLRLIVLNACYSDKQADEIVKHIDSVVGVTGLVDDIAAIAFSSAFYEVIASGHSVKKAFGIAQSELEMENILDGENMKLRSRVDPAKLVFVISPNEALISEVTM